MNSKNNYIVVVSDLFKSFYLRKPTLFGKKGKTIEALKGVSLCIPRGETVSLIGESGSGKTTLAKLIALIIEPDSGSIDIDGIVTHSLSRRNAKSLRQKIHLIFQDPYSSLNPRLTIRDIVMEPLVIQNKFPRIDRINLVTSALIEVGLDPSIINKFPNQFSGGQRQRIAIARAIVAKPDLIIADEPLSALDVSIQSQIINLMLELKKKKGLTYLFISHDLSVVSYLSDWVIVMYRGEIIESGPTESVFRKPLHPYTRLLISTTPSLGKMKHRISNRNTMETKKEFDQLHACSFYLRCEKTSEICRFNVQPACSKDFYTPEHTAKCHFPGQVEPKI